MDYLGKHMGFETYFLDFNQDNYNSSLPDKNWFCCAIANSDFETGPNSLINSFVRTAIERNVLSWHGLGLYGEKLHDTFDLIMVEMEVEEGHDQIDVCTVGQNEPDIANDFWGCYGAPCLSDQADYDRIKLICVSFDMQNYREELENLISRFNAGWLPPEPIDPETETLANNT